MPIKIKHKKISKLRFPEFSDEWEEKKLVDMIEKIVDNRGKTPPIQDSGVPLVEVNAIGNKQIDYSRIKKYVSDKIFNEWFRVHLKKGDILFSTVGATAICSLYMNTQKSAIAQNIVGLRFKEDNPEFIFYLLTENKNNHKFKRIEMGAVQPSVKVSQMIKIKFPVPSLPEQKKIAEFLTVVDEWIENLKAEKKSLESYKKGMMQKIFDRNLPAGRQVRFKDKNGKEFPRWEEKKLGAIATINPGYQRLPDKFIYIDLESVEKGILKQEKVIEKSDAPSRAQRILQKNDILFQTVRPYQQNNLYFNKNGKYVASTGYAQIRTEENPMFLYQYLHIGSFLNKVLARCIGTSYPAINSNDLKSIKINLPHKKEQEKIAGFLTSLDKVIESKQQQITQAEHWKKGLMQVLFV